MVHGASSSNEFRSWFGAAGLLLGMLAFGIGLGHFFMGPIEQQPTLEEVVADKAVKIRDAVVARLKDEPLPPTEPQAPQRDLDELLVNGTVVAGFIAIVLATVGFIRREDLRMTGSATVFGVSAIALQFVIIALAVLIFDILIGAVLDKLSFDI